MAITKLGLYNNALILLGQRVLSSDIEDRPNRHKLDTIYDEGAVDYCLEIVKPKFACKLINLVGETPTLVTGFTEEATLPSDFLTIKAVYADASMDQVVERYTHEGNFIESDFATIYVRYVQDFATAGMLYMPVSFGRVVSAYLARELSITVDPQETENMDTQLGLRIEISQDADANTEAASRGLAEAALSDDWRKIYNDGFQILGLDHIVTNTDDSLRRTKFDIARAADLVEAAFEDTSWHFANESAEMTRDPGIEPEFGPQYAVAEPSDMHRLDGVWADEYRQYPIKDYAHEGGYIYTDYQIIYIQFVSNDYLTTPSTWPSYFKRFVAAQLARDAGPSILAKEPSLTPAQRESRYKIALNEWERRRDEAMSTDAIQSPPTTLTRGAWAESRNNQYSTTRRNRP
jgi:hypothetical protein